MQKRGRFDYILLETTGLADPGPIASIFWHNEDLSEDILLDGVVCVVDGVFGLQVCFGLSFNLRTNPNCVLTKSSIANRKRQSHRRSKREPKVGSRYGTCLCWLTSSKPLWVSRQVGCADIVLLNKADITKSEELSKMEATIRGLNPTAPIQRTVKGNIDLAKILDLRAYSAQPNFFETQLAGHSAHEDDGHIHDDSCSHINDITSLLIPVPKLNKSQAGKLDEWIRTVLWDGHLPESPNRTLEVLRCKGFWQLDDGTTFVLQGVKSLYETREEAPKVEGEDVSGKVVLIGKGLDATVSNSLQNSLELA